MIFYDYCKKKNIQLTRSQKACADVILRSAECRMLLFGGPGSGKTFLFKLLEGYANEEYADEEVERKT